MIQIVLISKYYRRLILRQNGNTAMFA